MKMAATFEDLKNHKKNHFWSETKKLFGKRHFLDEKTKKFRCGHFKPEKRARKITSRAGGGGGGLKISFAAN